MVEHEGADPRELLQIGSIEEMMGDEIPVYDVVEDLTALDEPFQILSTRVPQRRGHEATITYNIRPDQGKRNMPRFGNSERDDAKKFDEPIIPGMLKVDRDNKRLLHMAGSISMRDSYRSWGKTFGYAGRVVDIVREMQDDGYVIFQATRLEMVPLLTLKDEDRNIKSAANYVAINMSSKFEALTRIDNWEDYQLEGERTLEQVLAGESLPITPQDTDPVKYYERLIEQWGNSIPYGTDMSY